jgi:Carboxypeptidase regulatory-like domain
MKRFLSVALAAICMIASASSLSAQGVTTGSLAGRVTAQQGGEGMPGVRVRALHQPSGTAYQALTRSDGRYTIAGMRVGGPYTVTANSIGYAPKTESNVSIQLGVQTEVSFVISPVAVQLAAVAVTAQTTGGTLSQSRRHDGQPRRD